MKAIAITTIRQLLKGTKGAATSLVEASATIAVGAVLAGAALGTGGDVVESARIATTKEHVTAIGQAVLNFYQDNVVYPGFRDGTQSGPVDLIFENLASLNGTYCTDASDSDPATAGLQGSWDVGTTAAVGVGRFGDEVEATSDSLENHLQLNTPANDVTKAYPLRGVGAFGSDDSRGWDGPYLQNLPSADSWGSKFMINVQELNVGHLSTDHVSVNTVIAVFAISCGPNQALDTSSVQVVDGDNIVVIGDDIGFRIR